MRFSGVIYNNSAVDPVWLSNSRAVLLPVGQDTAQIDPIPQPVNDVPLSPERITLMNFNVTSRLTATFAAVAIAATTFSAAPAFADRHNDRAAHAIATVLGIAVVGKIIHDNNKGRSNKHVTVKRPRHDVGNSRTHSRPKDKRVGRATLPRKCFQSFRTRHGQVNMFAHRCLKRSFNAVHRLPSNCKQRVQTHRGKISGFNARCLKRNGFRVSRR